jgi:PAS domain S-box-containing protein
MDAIKTYSSSHELASLRSEVEQLRRELAHTQQLLAEHEERFRLVSEAVDGTIVDWDVGSQQYFRTRYVEVALGYKPHEIPQTVDGAKGLVHPDDLPGFNQASEEWLRGKDTHQTFEIRCRHAAGHYRHMRAHSVVQRDPKTGEALRVVSCYLDVSAEKEALAALQASEQRYRLATEAFAGISFEWNLATGHFVRSGNVTKLLGYDPHEIEPTIDWGRQLMHPEDVGRFKEEWEHALAGADRVFTTEMRIKHKLGDYRWIRVHAIIQRDEAGRANRVHGCYTDISEQIQVEASLRRSEERYRLATEALDGIVFDWNVPANRVYRSSGVVRLLGYQPEEVVSVREWWIERLHPDDRALFVREVDRFVEKGELRSELSYRVQHALGHYLWVRASFLAIRDSLGKAERVIGCITDITERRNAEDRQRAAERIFRQLFNDIPLGVGVVDPELNIIEVNHTMAEQLGYSVEELQRLNIRDITDPEEFDSQLRSTYQKLWSGEIDQFQWEKHYLRKDGSKMPVLLRYKKIQYGKYDKPCGLGIVEDLTDRKRAEAERGKLERHLQEAQKLESLGVLAGGIAHDFNNLLTVILGNLSLVRQELPRQAEQQDPLQQAEDAGKLAAELCRQMLAYAGRGKLENRPIDLSQLVEASRALITSAAGRHGRLTFQLATGLPSLAGDSSQIRQVLLNLVHNAADALPHTGGAIIINTGACYLDQAALKHCRCADQLAPGAYVWVEVRDSGAGMDEATIRHIFEPFFTTKFTGRGLGLAAVAGIVRAHRGAVQIQSAPGTGTQFRVYFPVDFAPAQNGAASPLTTQVQDKGPGKGTVLIVDDEASVRTVLVRLFAKWGFTAVEAEDGEVALDVARRHGDSLRLVVLDLTMPRRDGLSTLSELRKEGKRMPVIITSGYYSAELSPQLDQYQAVFVAKPFQASDLLAIVQGLVTAK